MTKKPKPAPKLPPTDPLPPHPMQPVIRRDDGLICFRENKIVAHLLDVPGPHDMNSIAMLPFSREDREQFAQLIGYSVSGFHELSYVSDPARMHADLQVANLWEGRR